MEKNVKRPWSVWIAQFFLIYALVMFVLGFVLALRTPLPSDISFVRVLFTAIWIVAFIGLFVTAFWGMAARKPYGRWIGVAVLSFLLIFMNAEQIFFGSNSTRLVLKILLSVLLFVVILHISLSEKAAAFFPRKERKITRTPFDLPPPPPTFDD